VVDNFPQYPRIRRTSVAPSFFSVMGLSIVYGRTFLRGEQNVVIASESAARAFWPDQDPLGQLWTVGGAKRTVVGVVADSGVDETAADSVEAYLPISPRDVEASILILRTRHDAAPMSGDIERLAADLDQTVTMIPMTLLLEARQNGNSRLTALFGCLGLIATVLAGAGMFALMAFTVAQRTREIGIRMAIGATSADLLARLLRLHAKPLAGGVVKGVFAGVMLLLFVRALIYPERLVVLMAGVVLGLASFVVVAALSVLLPALRALRIDPSAALHTE
jgi:ABC-type antimicrobial peptide transport system permease subunit